MKWDGKVKWGLFSGVLLSVGIGMGCLFWSSEDELQKEDTNDFVAPAISASPESSSEQAQGEEVGFSKSKDQGKSSQAQTPAPPKKEIFPHLPVEKREFLEGVPASFSFPVLSAEDSVKESMWQGAHQAVLLRDDVAFTQFFRAASEEKTLFLAYWGLCMVDMGPEYEGIYQKSLAYVKERMKQGPLLPDEKAFGESCLAWDSGKGRQEAAAPLLTYMKKHKAHLFMRLMAALFLREGYEPSGKAKLGQEEATALLEEALSTNPENHALVYVRAFLEETAPTPSERALACAQKAVELAPKNPSSQHLLGHFLYRKGAYAEAQKCFETTLALLDATRNPLSVTLAGDSEWLKAFLYRTACLDAQGRHEEAFVEALKLSALPWDEKRPLSKGALVQLWECSSLAARLALAFEGENVAEKAAQSLPCRVQEPLKADIASLSDVYLRVLFTYWQARPLLSKKGDAKEKKVRLFFEALDDFKGSSSLAYKTGQTSEWTRAEEVCRFLEADMQARQAAFSTLSVASPEEATLWREKSVKAQRYASLLFPPALPFSVEKVAASIALEAAQPLEAKKWVELGQKRFPSHASWTQFSLGEQGELVFLPKSPAYALLEKAKETATPTPRPADSSKPQTSSTSKKRRPSYSRSSSQKKSRR